MYSLLGIFSKPVSKLSSLSKLHVIEPFKSYLDGTISGQVDQLLTKVECCSHTKRESNISWSELWFPCLLSWLSGVAAEITRLRLQSYSDL